MKKVLTTCSYCGCGCNLYLHVQDDHLVGVSPSFSHPVSKGKLCVKGWRGFGFVNHQDRLKKPLIKEKDGTFREATWKEAISVIADKMNHIKKQYSPNSIGVLSSARCTNEDNYIFVKLARSVFGTPHVDHCARL